ncbi:MAG: transposase [Acidobacteriota bacterium]|nr:transposase [Acidobacteriota bacterium]
MMGEQKSEPELFNYAVNLEKRVRANHPLRRVKAAIDFAFVREEVAHLYGKKGNESVAPEVILKMMFLLFFDDVASERELMKIIAERLDYLWFLGYGLEEEIPDHSVLSKARRRWGKEVFESLFVRTVAQCVEAGLVDGKKLHVDSSLIEADASREAVIKGTPELIAALKRAYEATESKLGEGVTTPESYEAVNDRMMSTTDPDAAMVSRGRNDSRPRYHHHRAIDDAKGVVTAVESTPGSVTENRKLLDLIDQHESNTSSSAQTVVGDRKYGTQDNFVACQERGLTTHLGDAAKGQDHHRAKGIFPESAFVYDPPSDTFRCPAGELLKPRRVHPIRHTMEYKARAGACAVCRLRAQCTRAKMGRTLHRHEKQVTLDLARAQAHSAAGRRDRRRRQQLMEQSFADAANNHHFKRARWRRLWRQQIQDYLIAAIQNVRILLAQHNPKKSVAAAVIIPPLLPKLRLCFVR